MTSPPEGYTYPGGELDVFRLAANWKRYLRALVKPYLSGRILEVGAGIGANTTVLFGEGVEEWVCLEPDGAMLKRLEQTVAGKIGSGGWRAVRGTVGDLPGEDLFDAILYLDVLEHIEDDSGELAASFRHLLPGGRIVVVSPAHMSLFSEFDRSVGHRRRYDRSSLRSLAPSGLRVVEERYLDSVGALASLANRHLLRSGMPGRRQILFWDRFMIPLSRVFDALAGYRIGKSIMTVWERRP